MLISGTPFAFLGLFMFSSDSLIYWVNDDNDKEHKKRQQTDVLRIHKQILSALLVLFFFVTIGVLALFVLPKPMAGLLTPHTLEFAPVPSSSELHQTACIDDSE